jgi:hypothetical protein
MRKALLAAVAGLLLTPSGAFALANAIRYTAPNGSGTVCSQAQRCPLKTAIDASGAGDIVEVGAGTYGPITDVLTIGTSFLVEGEPGQPIPVVVMNSAGGVGVTNGGSVSRLDLRQTGGSQALSVANGSADQISARSGSIAGCTLLNGASLRNTLCVGGAEGVSVAGVSGSLTAALRNVTLASSSPNGSGLVALGSGGTVAVNATNTIAHGSGSGRDILASGTATITLDHSNYSNVATSDGATITPNAANGNQDAAPVFVNAGTADFREFGTSPTVDAGATDATADGDFDFDGGPRHIGPAVDIGADETARLILPPSGGAMAIASVSGYGLSRSTFAAASKGPSAQAAAKKRKRKKAKVGTTVSYTLNEAATVTFTVQRRTTGRKVKKKGKKARCVARTRKNRRKRKCTRYVKLKGSFTQAGKAGKNRFKFSGRLRSRKLKPGRYKLIATPSAGGQKGKARSKAFRIVR